MSNHKEHIDKELVLWQDKHVVIQETYYKEDGIVWHKWRVRGWENKPWNIDPTPLKEVPFVELNPTKWLDEVQEYPASEQHIKTENNPVKTEPGEHRRD